MNYTPLEIGNVHKEPVKNHSNRFWILAVCIFTLFIQFANIDPGQFVNPLSQRKDAFSEVRTKLAAKKNNYSLHTSKSIIPKVYADSAATDNNAFAVIDFESGDVIADKNLSEPVAVASLTKIMTAVVALDLASPDELFRITATAADEIPTKIVMWPGERMSLWELLHASMMTSANDATEAIKEGIDAKYGQHVFIDAMNEKAKLIGLKNTHFVNPQGFDNPDHYSTAEDMAILSHYALTNYPLIAEISAKEELYLPENPYHHAHRLVNWNGLIGVYPNVTGVKIGNTGWAGTTTVVVSERQGKKILAVLLGAQNVLSRDSQAIRLLNLGFEQKYDLEPVVITEDQLYAKYATWN